MRELEHADHLFGVVKKVDYVRENGVGPVGSSEVEAMRKIDHAQVIGNPPPSIGVVCFVEPDGVSVRCGELAFRVQNGAAIGHQDPHARQFDFDVFFPFEIAFFHVKLTFLAAGC